MKRTFFALTAALLYFAYFVLCIAVTALVFFPLGLTKYTSLASVCFMLGALAFIIKARGGNVVEALCIVPVTYKTVFTTICLSVAVMFSIQAIQLFMPAGLLAQAPNAPMPDGVISIISIIFASPAAEELIFRVLILGRLKKAIPVPAAVIISSFLFACLHVGIVWGTLAFLAGVYYSLLFIKSKSAFVPLIAHITCNFTAVLYNFVVSGGMF